MVCCWRISFYYTHIVPIYVRGMCVLSIVVSTVSFSLVPNLQVEHEASVIGTKLIGTLAAISAFLAYMIFRQWFAHQLKPMNSGRSNTTLTAPVSRAIDR